MGNSAGTEYMLSTSLEPGYPFPQVADPPDRLRSPLALAWRLRRGLLTGWTTGFTVMGQVLGRVAAGVGDLVTDDRDLQDLFAGLGGQAGLIDAFLAAMAGLYRLVAAGYAVQATLGCGPRRPACARRLCWPPR